MTGRSKILVVDDRPENLKAVRSVLADLDAEIHTATSGADALSQLLDHDYAVVLLDVQMPEMDGFETAELMRGREATRRVPIIFVTAGAWDQRQLFQGYDAGAVDFLYKPFDPHVLRSKVRVFVELDQKSKELEQRMDDLRRADEVRQFLLEASDALASTLDYAGTLERLAGLLVPRIGDWCAIYMQSGEALELVTAMHRSPAKTPLIRELERRHPLAGHGFSGPTQALRSLDVELIEDVAAPALETLFRTDEASALARRIGVRSLLFVPLVCRGAAIGVLAVATGDSGRALGADEVALVKDLASRGALAVDNARHYRLAQAEIARREASERALRFSEARFRRLYDANVVGIFRARYDGVIADANDLFLAMIGADRAELEAGTLRWDARTPPEQRERDRVYVRELIEKGFVLPFEKDYLRPDGTRVPVLLACAGLEGGDEAICVAADLTALKRAEAELARARDAAEEANRAKSAFLANMSHEIRTPLGVIRGFVDLLLEAQPDPEEARDWLQTVRRNALELSGLIDDILDLSKVEAQKLEVEKTLVDVGELIQDVVRSFEIQAKERGLSLEVKLARETPRFVQSDPRRLRQVLVNIVGNALKFTHEGGVTVSVRPFEGPGGKRQLELLVEDTGIGLDAAEQARIFQRFTQADGTTTRRYGGTGLGLVLSRELARALGGDLTLARSAPGRGSAFAIRIDQGFTPSVRQQPGERSVAPVDLDGQLDGMRILLVEDARDNQLFISRILTRAGAAVDVASNGREALECAEKGEYAAVLMDIQMPEVDGYEATRSLRAKGYDRPIIALTAHAMAEERERTRRAGFDDHLSKPVDRRELIESLRRHAGALIWS